MDKFASIIGEKMGDMVEKAVKKALGADDEEDEDKDKNKGILSIFGGDDDKDKDKDKGGLFSFGDDKKKDEDKGGFFSKIFDKDDDKGEEKPSGFHGLFIEQGAAAGGGGGQIVAGSEGGGGGGMKGQTIGVNDGDLFDDLMDVAAETSKGK
ncbi:zinc finger protein AEBP2-like [Notolabrus celidotus]|uniref:zinc finger protein AEBP2-like n=1 Tax=Notolabrus celidotus TaxID=1203425 RepID=UPI00149033DE|nr:zinc finger protein AEBP2-like [Notolabrus celidotus]